MLSSGSIRVRADCIQLDVSEDVLLSNADVRTRYLEKTSPIQRVRDAKIIFEESVDDSSVSAKPMILTSFREVNKVMCKKVYKFLTAVKMHIRVYYRRKCQRSVLIVISEAILDSCMPM